MLCRVCRQPTQRGESMHAWAGVTVLDDSGEHRAEVLEGDGADAIFRDEPVFNVSGKESLTKV